MARCLVTGVAGFIGSHLAEALVKQGWSVVGVDNLSNGFKSNIARLMELPPEEFQFICGDVRGEATCRQVMDGVEVVFHLAALGSVPRSVGDPVATHSHNATATLQLLRVAEQSGVKCFVYSSSSSVYGETKELPKVESMTPSPVSPYAASKLAAETYCRAFWKTYSFPTIALRYFNVYGPRQRPDGPYAAVIPRWAEAMIHGRRTLIYGDGKQSRDFTFVEDVVRANLAAGKMRRMTVGEQAFGKTFNIGHGSPVTLLKLHACMAEILGYRGEGEHMLSLAGDVRHSHACMNRARADLRYESRWSLDEGLERTLKWYRRRYA